MTAHLLPAPPLTVREWLNVTKQLDLEAVRGRVVLIEAFQMLCPGCVSHGLPQAKRVRETFREDDVAVIGLHSVFEHHDAQTPVALEAFLHEYQISFPIAVDEPGEDRGLPRTMATYGMQGTPTLVLIDRQGRRRVQHFGHVPDLRLGAEIMALIVEREDRTTTPETVADPSAPACYEAGCIVPTSQEDRPA